MRTCNRWMSAFLLFLPVTAVGNRAATVQDSIARDCVVDKNQPAQRIFADPEGKNAWREHKRLKDVPEIENSGHFAQLWTGTDGKVFVGMEEPSEDWITYSDYCFSKTGQLVALRFEVRTYWGYGFRESGAVVKGLFRPGKREFFNTDNQARITRPEQAEDFIDALKPCIYNRKSRLPFARLLSK